MGKYVHLFSAEVIFEVFGEFFKVLGRGSKVLGERKLACSHISKSGFSGVLSLKTYLVRFLMV